MKKLNLAGQVFGRLTILREALNKGAYRTWWCRCSCGIKKVVRSSDLRQGSTKSCGCLRREFPGRCLKHGHTAHNRATPEYKTWQSAKDRCHNPKNIVYNSYGGRGIVMCPEWRASFSTFLSDMGSRPLGFTLDRTDVNGDYTPSNCRWVTLLKQANNKRTSLKFNFNGEQLSLAEIARLFGVNYGTLQRLVKYRGKEPISEAKRLATR